MRVAFLGLGRRESSMFAALFRAGHQLVTWEGPWAGACPEVGGVVVRLASLADVLAGADAVISLGPDDQAVHDLVMRRGLLDFMAADTVHVSMSRASVPAAQHLTEMHEAKQQRFVSAPLIRQAPGSVSIVAAGLTEAVRQVEPLLEAIGQCIVVGATPWHANLVSLGIDTLADGGPDRAEEVHATIRAAGISLELFRQVARTPLPVDDTTPPAGMVPVPPDRLLLRSDADFADHT